MAALHGREDALLDAGRFPRLLRQANDAEIADVRKVGDDDYEISPRRMGGVAPTLSAPAAAALLRPSPPSRASRRRRQPPVGRGRAGRGRTG